MFYYGQLRPCLGCADAQADLSLVWHTCQTVHFLTLRLLLFQVQFTAFMIVTGTSAVNTQVFTAYLEVCDGTACSAYVSKLKICSLFVFNAVLTITY